MLFTFKPGLKYIIKGKHKISKGKEYIYKKYDVELGQHVFTNGDSWFTISYRNRSQHTIRRAT